MNKQPKFKWLYLPAFVINMVISSVALAGEKLNAEELRSLLVGSFMKIVYLYEGEGVEMWEYYQKDGTVAGSTDKWGDYSATYKISEDGRMCLTYGSEAYDGCYSYERVSDNQYKLVDLTWPENTTLDVTIVPADSNNIRVD